MEIKHRINDHDGSVSIEATVNQASAMALMHMIHDEIACQIASRFVKEHYHEIASVLDPQAIANMTIAEAAAKVNETLHKKLPDKILEIQRTVHHDRIFKRTIFGNLKEV